MKTILRTFVGCTAILFGTACMGAVKYVPENMKVELSLKVPGNNAVNYKLHPDKLENSYFDYEWRSDNKLPITVFHKVEERDSCMRLTVQLTAAQDVYFNYRQLLSTAIAMITVSFICRDFGIAVICVLLKKLHHSIRRIVGWFVKTG